MTKLPKHSLQKELVNKENVKKQPNMIEEKKKPLPKPNISKPIIEDSIIEKTISGSLMYYIIESEMNDAIAYLIEAGYNPEKVRYAIVNIKMDVPSALEYLVYLANHIEFLIR